MILVGVATYRRAARTLPVWIERMSIVAPPAKVGALMVACDGEHALETALPLARHGFGVVGRKERVGVATNKSRIFRFFLENKAYSHLFLFEDDCWPIKEGWMDFYLDHHERGQTECLLFLPPGMYGALAYSKLLPAGAALNGYTQDGGMLLSLTRKAIETCGGFHKAFKAALYGGEHSELVRRLTRNALMPWTYLAPRGCEAYFDGWDYASWRGKLRDQPGYADWCNDVKRLPRGQGKKEAEQGLAIFDRVKDDGSVFHDPRWEK